MASNDAAAEAYIAIMATLDGVDREEDQDMLDTDFGSPQPFLSAKKSAARWQGYTPGFSTDILLQTPKPRARGPVETPAGIKFSLSMTEEQSDEPDTPATSDVRMEEPRGLEQSYEQEQAEMDTEEEEEYMKSSFSMVSQRTDDIHAHRVYHDAVLQYVRTQRNVRERLRLEKEVQALDQALDHSEVDAANETALTATGAAADLYAEMQRAQNTFLSSLSHLCRDRARSNGDDEDALRESYVWSLLATLHDLPHNRLNALLYRDDSSAHRQERQLLEAKMSNLATNVNLPPGDILDKLYDMSADSNEPLMLHRRVAILKWLERCNEDRLEYFKPKSSSMWPDSFRNLEMGQKQPGKISTIHFDAPLLILEAVGASTSAVQPDPLYGGDSEQDAKMLKVCLNLIMAGKMGEARELCCDCGQAWRSATWTGGEPHSVENVDGSVVKVGNPSRALWKRQQWNLSQSLTSAMGKQPSGSVVEYDAAIASILSDDIVSALSNPALRSWESGLYVLVRALVSRTEEEILHRHNEARRKARRRYPYDGTEYRTDEVAQLQTTNSLTMMVESALFEKLSSLPYGQVCEEAEDCLRRAVASFITGYQAVTEFIRSEAEDANQLDEVRFLIHLFIFLDEATVLFSESKDLEAIKNAVILRYLLHLMSRSDLWPMTVLYASHLPTPSLVETFSSFLVQVEVESDRSLILKQAREHFPEGIDLTILQKVVRVILDDDEASRAALAALPPNIPSDVQPVDVRKMRGVLWMCFYEEHLGDALICSNMLLRQFLLASKLHSAMHFLDEYLPGSVSEMALQHEEENGEDIVPDVQVQNAAKEHAAFVRYLDAQKAFELWRKVISESSPVSKRMPPVVTESMNSVEREIALKMHRRAVVEEKDRVSTVVIEAAEIASEKLLHVLIFAGGWLRCPEIEGEEEIIRQRELHTLRNQCLPECVFMAHTVANETGCWMSAFAKDANRHLQDMPKHEPESSPLSPSYWHAVALELAETVAVDDNGIQDTFGADDMKRFLSLMAESAVKHLKSRKSSASVTTMLGE